MSKKNLSSRLALANQRLCTPFAWSSLAHHKVTALAVQLLGCVELSNQAPGDNLPGSLFAGLPRSPEGEGRRLPYALDTVEGPLDLSPRIQQSDRTSMRAVCRVFRFCKFQQ
jgi:hypothetical protein